LLVSVWLILHVVSLFLDFTLAAMANARSVVETGGREKIGRLRTTADRWLEVWWEGRSQLGWPAAYHQRGSRDGHLALSSVRGLL